MIYARATIGIIAALIGGNSAIAADEATVGKYVCLVTHMAGIQTRDDGTIASGHFSPNEPQFFIEIHRAVHPSDGCSIHDDTQGNWYLCHANFELQIDDKWRLRGDNTISFSGPLLAETEVFLLYSGGHSFTRFQTLISSGGYFVSDGKCSKVGQ